MFIALAVLHVLIALGLILVVLLQSGKGADIGAAFGGGSSQTVFGGRGAATFLSKVTTVLAVLFMVMSIVLTVHASRQGTTSVIPEDRPSPQSSTPAPSGPAPQQSQAPATPTSQQSQAPASPAPAAPAPQSQAPAAPPSPSK